MFSIKSDKFEEPAKTSNLPNLLDEPLFIHQHSQEAINHRLVIFVHGLNGDRYSTWGNFPKFIFEEENELYNVDVGMYAYVNGLNRCWSASIELDREAIVMADILRDTENYDSLVLVGHSMGGLLIKAAIKELIERSDHTTLKRIAGIFLLATPQLGSLRVPNLLSWLGKDMRALRPHSELVNQIQQTFSRRVSQDENSQTHEGGKFVIPVWAVVAAEDRWVDKLSAGIDIPDERRKDVRGSHTRIVKPKYKTEDTYRWVVANITKCFKCHSALQVPESTYLVAERTLTNLLEQYPLLPIAQVNPYDVLGVARTEHVDDYASRGEKPPYIPRIEADQELDQVLKKENRIVILTGCAKSGKSRTAFEAIKRNFPNYFVLIPACPSDPIRLPELLQNYDKVADHYPKAVLWLDDIQLFINVGSLTVSLLIQTRQKHSDLVIIATLQSIKFDSLNAGEGEIGRNAKNVLNYAARVQLDELLTDEEQKLAHQLYSNCYPNLNFTIAIGEAFVAAKELKDRFDNGSESCPAGAAVVWATIDCRRIGIVRPISENWLKKLWEQHYFHKLAPCADISDMAFNNGLNWAKQPLYRYAALLVKTDDSESGSGFSVPDYLVEHVERRQEPIPSAVWDLVLDCYKDLGFDITTVGYVAWQRGFTDKAKGIWEKGMSLGYDCAAFNLGLLLQEDGDHSRAREVYEKSIELGNGYAATQLGLLLEENGDRSGAKTAYEKGIKLGNGRAAANLGMLLEEDGNHSEAEAAYDKSIELGNSDAAFYLGNLLKEDGDHSGAKAAYNKGIELGNSDAAFCLGNLLKEDGDYSGAKMAFKKGIELGDGRAAANLGMLLEEDGDHSGAKAAYNKGIELGDGRAAANLGMLLEKDGDHSGAEAAYNKGIELGNSDAEVLPRQSADFS